MVIERLSGTSQRPSAPVFPGPSRSDFSQNGCVTVGAMRRAIVRKWRVECLRGHHQRSGRPREAYDLSDLGRNFSMARCILRWRRICKYLAVVVGVGHGGEGH